MSTAVTLEVAADPLAPAIVGLVGELDALQLSLYPQASTYLDSPSVLAAPHVHVVAAREGEAWLGCGAVKFYDADGYGEIKRLFVQPAARGRGIAKRIMDELESHARRRGVVVMRLETGIHQPEALGLYARLGYRRRARFGEYPDDPLSVFMQKSLDDDAAGGA